MQLQIVRSGLVGGSGSEVFRESDDKAGDSHLCANVKKLREDPTHQMTMLADVAQSQPRVSGLALLSHIGQTREIDHCGHSQKDCGDYKIRYFHRIRFVRGCLSARIPCVRQNERCPDHWRDHRTYRIERL